MGCNITRLPQTHVAAGLIEGMPADVKVSPWSVT
jgi:hypothetical protein